MLRNMLAPFLIAAVAVWSPMAGAQAPATGGTQAPTAQQPVKLITIIIMGITVIIDIVAPIMTTSIISTTDIAAKVAARSENGREGLGSKASS